MPREKLFFFLIWMFSSNVDFMADNYILRTLEPKLPLIDVIQWQGDARAVSFRLCLKCVPSITYFRRVE